MTPKERVMARLSGKPVDQIPNFNILISFAAHYAGFGIDAFCKDHRVLVEANIKANEAFGIDVLNTMSDPYRETADYGAKIQFRPDKLPVCEHFISEPSDLKKLKPFKIENSVRMLDRLHAIELYQREAGGHWPIMGWIEGCMAESSDLMGLTELIYAMSDEPEMVREMLSICLETAVNCIEPMVRAGASVIGVGDAAASVLGPAVYREWILAYEQKIFAEIRRCGAVGRLHICGNIEPLLDDLRCCGADIIDVDWMVDFALAHKKLKGTAFVCGNFNPVSMVRDGTPQQIKNAVNECCEAGGDSCFIMAGCEIPQDTPQKNLRAVADALRERG